jgi:hypothetical protein
LALVGFWRAAGLAFLGFSRAPTLAFLGFSARRPWLSLAFRSAGQGARGAEPRRPPPSSVNKREHSSTSVSLRLGATRKKLLQNVSNCQHPPPLRLPAPRQTQHREDAAGHASPPRYFTIEIHKSK